VELLVQKNKLLDTMPDFAGRPSSEEVTAWNMRLRDWWERYEGVCGNPDNFEPLHCGEMAEDGFKMLQASDSYRG
jgi:hypothetical protein